MLRFLIGLLTAAALPLPFAAPTFRQQTTPTGVVVEEVDKDGAAAKAGIQPGAVLVNWYRAATPPSNPDPARGELSSSFDLSDVEAEQAPRGDVTLTGTQNGTTFSVLVPAGEWGIRVRPQMPLGVERAYNEGKQLIGAKQTDRGLSSWRDAAVSAKNAKEFRLSCWLLLKVGDALMGARRWADARDAYELAGQEALSAGDRVVAATASDLLAVAFLRLTDPNKADLAYRRALQIWEELSPASLTVAASLHRLGVLTSQRSELTAAEQLFQTALSIRQRQAPGSLVMANTLGNLGIVARERGDLNAAREFYSEGLTIWERLVPNSLTVANTFNNLGVVADSRGDLASAEDLYRKALEMKERLAPDTLTLANTLHNLGNVALKRGDLAAAEDWYRLALRVREKVSQGVMPVAITLIQLGSVAQARGDLAVAEELYRRSMAAVAKAIPEGSEMATIFENLGTVARERGDLPGAEDFLQRSLAIKQQEAPNSLDTAATLQNLGILMRERGNVTVAEDISLRALAIRQKLAPANVGLAETLHELGLLSRRTGDSSRATDYFRRAVDVLESQKMMLGGSEETRTNFAARHVEYYHDFIDLLVKMGRVEEAFNTVERSRARGLLDMLAERQLTFSADIPANLERQRRLVAGEYDRTQANIARLDAAKDSDEIDRLLVRMRELREKQEEIGSEIRNASPRLARLQYPQTLTLDQAQTMLDPGTLLLSYVVTKDQTFLFAVQGPQADRSSTRKPAFTVFSLPIAEADLRRSIEKYRNGIQHPELEPSTWIQQGVELYRVLVQPAQDWIASSKRVLISPDGPLHSLPFGALVTSGPSNSSRASAPRYWIETKPVHVVTSATLYGQLRKEPRQESASLVAFGDPRYPLFSTDRTEKVSDPETRSAVRRGFSFERLPSTRTEVEAIARIYGKQTTLYLDKQATEERAKNLGTGARYIHFAVHGILDERNPLNSGLALTLPEKASEGEENGLLQAWEIFERVRIDADLVVLSACETALGKEAGGEGLIGLTRAFQYAGARSIVASLWSVADDSTGELMERMYTHLKMGKSKDEALRAAQMDLIRRKRNAATGSLGISHPFYWAAFQLIGDWK